MKNVPCNMSLGKCKLKQQVACMRMAKIQNITAPVLLRTWSNRNTWSLWGKRKSIASLWKGYKLASYETGSFIAFNLAIIFLVIYPSDGEVKPTQRPAH